MGPLPTGRDREEATRRVLDVLERRSIRAVGFVNCGRGGEAVLAQWLERGHLLGNHTATHLDLNDVPPSAWAADARSCDTSVKERTGAPWLYFRYPYLHRGPTPERHRVGVETLEALRSPAVPVTINTADWVLDDAYVEALETGSRDRARRIADAYVEHVVRAAMHYRRVARERVGRDVDHVLLLHANALLSDRLEALLDGLAREGFDFIPVEEALRDPVYALEDDYVGPEGLSWLLRVPPAKPEAHAWYEDEVARLREVIGRPDAPSGSTPPPAGARR